MRANKSVETMRLAPFKFDNAPAYARKPGLAGGANIGSGTMNWGRSDSKMDFIDPRVAGQLQLGQLGRRL